MLTCGYLRLMEVRAPAGSLASSESRTACTVVARAWWVSVSTCSREAGEARPYRSPAGPAGRTLNPTRGQSTRRPFWHAAHGGNRRKGASAVGEASVRAGKGAGCRQRRDPGPAPRRARPGPRPTRQSQRNHLEACFPGRGEAAVPALALQPGGSMRVRPPRKLPQVGGKSPPQVTSGAPPNPGSGPAVTTGQGMVGGSPAVPHR